MIEDWKIEKFFRLIAKGETTTSAAREVGISYSTAMKYKKARMLPSNLHLLLTEKKPRLFDDRWEGDVGPYIVRHSSISPKALLTYLIEKHPDLYDQSMLRTIQRRVKEWKVQNHEEFVGLSPHADWPGVACVFQLFPLPRKVMIRGEAVPGTLFLFYLPYSKWIYLAPMRQRYLINILEGVEDALWSLGFVPNTLINNVRPRLTQPELAHRPRRTETYHNFCSHYNFRIREHIPWPSSEEEVLTKIRNAFKEKFKGTQKHFSFQTYDQFKNAITSISEELNSTVKKEERSSDERDSRRLPEKGIVMKLDAFQIAGKR